MTSTTESLSGGASPSVSDEESPAGSGAGACCTGAGCTGAGSTGAVCTGAVCTGAVCTGAVCTGATGAGGGGGTCSVATGAGGGALGSPAEVGAAGLGAAGVGAAGVARRADGAGVAFFSSLGAATGAATFTGLGCCARTSDEQDRIARTARLQPKEGIDIWHSFANRDPSLRDGARHLRARLNLLAICPSERICGNYRSTHRFRRPPKKYAVRQHQPAITDQQVRS